MTLNRIEAMERSSTEAATGQNSADGFTIKVRKLLKQLRTIMAHNHDAPDPADKLGAATGAASISGTSGVSKTPQANHSLNVQARLDQIVTLIAHEMVVDVCSLYVMRAGEVLELFATQGLRSEAIHNTRLRVGEGLVGTIAALERPLALADAWTHPNFAYRPETGEDIYRSFLGVPVLRNGRVLGVVAVQSREMRSYDEEEIETIETVAMLLGELVATGELIDRNEITMNEPLAIRPGRFEGIVINPGIAIGRAILHRPLVTIKEMLTDNPEQDLERLERAIVSMQTQLDQIITNDFMVNSEVSDIFESYRMFSEDRGWLNKIRAAIRSGLSVEAAVMRTQQETRMRMRDVSDPYLRERLSDFEDLSYRLMQHLAIVSNSESTVQTLEDFLAGSHGVMGILIARSMGPVELLEHDRHSLRGLVLEEGSPTSHVAIVARAFEIPIVGRVKDILNRVEHGDSVIVDGDQGQVFVRPAAEITKAYRQSIERLNLRRDIFKSTSGLVATSHDQITIKLYANAGLISDVIAAEELGADGIGLYRTELGFMLRSGFPNGETQCEVYRRAMEAVGNKRVIFRTLDIGGDKMLPYFPIEGDENPAMGWRSIRISLDRPQLLRTQLRAMISAAAGRELAVMFPMIAEISELDQARAILDREVQKLKTGGAVMPTKILVGAMIEVPALFWQLPELLARVDFLSVGSNDLMQFMFATDRGSSRLVGRYDSLSPAMLRALGQLAAQCKKANVELSVCGEMAGQPLEAIALLAVGVRCLSMSPPRLGEIKQMIRTIDISSLSEFVQDLLERTTNSIRNELKAFVDDHLIVELEPDADLPPQPRG